MKHYKFLFILFTALGCQLMVKANMMGNKDKKKGNDSMVLGSITDTYTKKPLNDVTVLLSTGKQNKREVKTDASGAFAFFQLPPGEFTIIVEKKGYKSYRKEYSMTKDGIQLKIGMDTEEDDTAIDSWNPLRMIYGK